ncbi:MAG: FecR domain-containing protein, partial [Proteobacteria bacterium]|nr:FecR domain-containing protein [Pseudomonadota bacterium]
MLKPWSQHRQLALCRTTYRLVLLLILIGMHQFYSGHAYAKDPIGVLSAVVGTINIERDGKVFAGATADKVFEQDKIITFGKSRAQILLADQTAINISQNAELVLTKFVYGGDEETVAIKVSKGTFRFISGKVATSSPEKVNVETPVATIGVRGTEFIGQIDQAESLVALFNGKIQVANQSYTQEVSLPGFGVTIDSTGLISAATKIPEAQLNALLDAVSTRKEVLDEEISDPLEVEREEGAGGEEESTDPIDENGDPSENDGNARGDDELLNDPESSPSLDSDSEAANQQDAPKEQKAVFGVDLNVASEYREEYGASEFDSGAGDFSLESKIYSSDLIQMELYNQGFGDKRYAVSGGELESNLARNDSLKNINLFDAASRLESVGITDQIFFQIREFVALDDAPRSDIDDSALAFGSGTTFTVPENTANSTFITLSNVNGSALFSFDPALDGTDDRALFELNSSTGEFRFINAPDFEAPLDLNKDNTYIFNLLVSDSVSTLRGQKNIRVENLGAPSMDGIDSAVQLVASLNPALFTDWADFFAIAQDGNFTWDRDTSSFSSVCNSSSGACLKLDSFFLSYSTNTDNVSLAAGGSFTGLVVSGTETNGTFNVNFSNHNIDKFVRASTPGTFSVTSGASLAGSATPDADDSINIFDSEGSLIASNVTLTVDAGFNQALRDGFNTLTSARLRLDGTSGLGVSVSGVELFAEIGRPTVTGDENKAPILVSVVESFAQENSLNPFSANFGDFDADLVTATLDPSTDGTDDRALFTLSANRTSNCLNLNREGCFFLTPIQSFDFENPQDRNSDNNYVINLAFSDGAFDRTVAVSLTVQNDSVERPLNALAINENDPSDLQITSGSETAFSFQFDTNTATLDDQNLFDLDPNTGEITFKNPPDFETPLDRNGDNLYLVQIVTNSGGGSFATTQQQINVNDVAAPNANIFSSNVQAFTASVNTVVGTWEAYFAGIGDGILTWDPDLSGISQVCSGSQCLDVDRFFVSYNT